MRKNTMEWGRGRELHSSLTIQPYTPKEQKKKKTIPPLFFSLYRIVTGRGSRITTLVYLITLREILIYPLLLSYYLSLLLSTFFDYLPSC
jgi:hypothetical protein